MLEKLMNIFKTAPEVGAPPPEISPDTEARMIKRLLERKFGHEFAAKVAVDGYLDSMEYRLVMHDFDAVKPGGRRHFVAGDTVRDPLALAFGFNNAYWRNVMRAQEAMKSPESLDRFDRECMDDYLETAVAGSREEMLLKAAVEGMP